MGQSGINGAPLISHSSQSPPSPPCSQEAPGSSPTGLVAPPPAPPANQPVPWARPGLSAHLSVTPSRSLFSASLLADGVFGRCQEFPAVDALRYEVSPGVLQHLTATLQKLSRTGSTASCLLPTLSTGSLPVDVGPGYGACM
uniref:Uncharacterized protein n=1 Tax=Bos indicus x Bos taurus TaxID=30522 RepID=A0A4W2D6D7_BOBOX